MAGLVSFGGSPAVVHDGVVQVIKDRLQSEDRVHFGSPLGKEERARVAGRILRRVEVVFDTRRTADDRVRVLVGLSRSVRVSRQ